ncbi:MAG TPA: alpha/beta fold hydrolase [Thermoprotei archaeon]|nr:MAG: hypothetical protein DRJ63_01550 [Thermoprotei archaeon]HDI75314.1 alpha/beta fold hydrolase [Thermoprotei archaeon]
MRIREEEGVLEGSKYVVKIPSAHEFNCCVVGCRGWAYRGEYREGLHRHLDPLGNYIVENGFLWAATDYGAGGYPLRKALKSIKSLINYIRKKYGVEKIGLLGTSMGGHFALMYAIEHPEDVSCVVDIYGVADIRAQVKHVVRALQFLPASLLIIRKPSEIKSAIKFLQDIKKEFGGNPFLLKFNENYSRYNPIERVSELKAPVLIVHGTKDYAVPLKISLKLAEELKKHGKSFELHIVEGTGHDEETIKKALPKILDFLSKHLKK